MKKALVVDWLDKYGGAERVIATFEKIFSFDVTYTLVNIMEQDNLRKIYPKGTEVLKETRLKKLNKKFRVVFFSFQHFIKTIKIDRDIDLILSSSHAVAKGVRKSHPNQLHISYFQARNFNYIWSDYKLYFGAFRHLLYPMVHYLRKEDIRQGQNPDYIISNSVFVQQWVKEKYGRESTVIYPPVNLEPFHLETEKEDYFVAVGRLVYVKRFDIAIKAFNKSGKKLIVIGDGDQARYLKKMAGPNIIFTGFLDSSEVHHYVSKARGFIQTGIEGFGIAPIEAQACGTPVIAYGDGGVVETVKPGETGVFFEAQTVESLGRALEIFESTPFNAHAIRTHAMRFSTDRFEKEITSFVAEKWRAHKQHFS